jgi:hypothetical protein
VSVSDWSTVAANNTTIEGISIAENCPAANVNDVARAMAAAIKSFSLTVSSPSGSYMPLSGGTFTGQIKRSGSGGYLYNAAGAQSGGAFYALASGSALPSSPQEGTWVAFYQ